MRSKHLELRKSENNFLIHINSLVGRLSLFADHPTYKLKDAVNLTRTFHRTSGSLSLVPMKTKNLFILEDCNDRGEKAQNFVFVSEDLSKTMSITQPSAWVKEHLFDFFTRSISVLFLALYLVYYFSFMRYFTTTETLDVLRYITGVITVLFAVSYYYIRSSKTKSSFLRVCYKTELICFISIGTLNNIFHLNYFFNSAMDIF